MGFSQSLSGLNSASQMLNVISNNIANAETVGFKTANLSFADIYGDSRVGLGVKVNGIMQSFQPGVISKTGNSWDIAIDGSNGLFVVQQPDGTTLYTRNGQFAPDKNNKIVNASGQQLMGYNEDKTKLVGISIPYGNIAPQATTSLSNTLNLDARNTPITATFDANDQSTYNDMIPVIVYDSLGNEHTLKQYYTKKDNVGTQSNWEVNYTIDDNLVGTQALVFNSNGSLASNTPFTLNYNIAADPNNAPAQPLAILVDNGSSTQYKGDFSSNFIQDGYATGEYSDISIDTNGDIIAKYTNGEEKAIGTIALANFNNLQGLKPVGNNAWAQTATSGQAIMSTPGKNGLATVQGQAVEKSNVDVSQQFIDMITAQQNYQVNVEMIKTQDEILKSLLAI